MTALARVTTAPTTSIALGGASAVLDLSGVMVLPDEAALVVADLHLEKGSAFARRGQLLPPYDTRDTLARLAEAIARYAPRLVVALGDSFHDVGGPERLSEEDAASLAALQKGRDWLWVTGNHDREIPESVGGDVAADARLGPLTLRHEPQVGAEGEVAGHLHPVGKVVMRGRSVRRRCFATDGSRLVMPAFGAYAGGLNVCDAAFKPLFPGAMTAHLMGEARLFAITRAMLCRD